MADADEMEMTDVEKQAGERGNSSSSSQNRLEKESYEEVPKSEGFFSVFTFNSFKRNPNARMVQEATDAEGRPLKDQPPAEPALAMKLKQRHLQMIAIGGSIGS